MIQFIAIIGDMTRKALLTADQIFCPGEEGGGDGGMSSRGRGCRPRARMRCSDMRLDGCDIEANETAIR